MVLPRVSVFFLVLIVLSGRFLAEAQQCQKCETRSFKLEEQSCICGDHQFCNTSSNTCGTCDDECYDVWNNVIEQKKDRIQIILNQLIEKYLDNLDELQALNGSLSRIEEEIKTLNDLSKEGAEKLSRIGKDITEIKLDLQDAFNKLKKLGPLMPLPNLVAKLTEIRNNMKTILDKLKNQGFPDLDFDYLNNIQAKIDEMNRNFPALNDLNLEMSEDWIEQELLWLYQLLNNYTTVSLDIDGLEKNATRVKISARTTDKRLEDLIKKHKDLEKLLKELKSELSFYQELDRVLKRLENIVAKIKGFNRTLQIVMKRKKSKEDLNRELDNFFREREKFMEKNKKLENYKEKLKKLYDEQEAVYSQYNDLQKEVEPKPINQFIEESKDLLDDIGKMASNLTSHCARKY